MLHPNLTRAIDEIDTTVFNGDTFEDPEARDELLECLTRWTKHLAVATTMPREHEAPASGDRPLTVTEIRDAIDGLAAYDHGALDSGICDEGLRRRVKLQLIATPTAERNAMFAAFVIYLFLSPEALAQGYSVVDAKEFIEWLEIEQVLP